MHKPCLAVFSAPRSGKRPQRQKSHSPGLGQSPKNHWKLLQSTVLIEQDSKPFIKLWHISFPAMSSSSCLNSLTALMNCWSLDPMSHSMASLTVGLESNGPGVKSFFTGRPPVPAYKIGRRTMRESSLKFDTHRSHPPMI